ncbi:MAG: EAL domain-containing response regulator [Deltaproteobacteria bacterium]|nr:EAL domain-containing response regulator [Deltaproteobacteria bacterium]
MGDSDSHSRAANGVRRVLLLDDEASVLDVLSNYLRSPRLEIVTCQEIEAAEAVLKHSHFDVVVTDLRVSELGGLEGMRLIRFVATHFPETVVLAMSGFVNEEVLAIGRAVGVTDVLQKPLDLKRLWEWVHGQGVPMEVGGEGPVEHMDLLDEFMQRNLVRAVFQPIADLALVEGPGEDMAGEQIHGYESLARAPAGTPLRNPEILFEYAARKERLVECDLMCIRAALRDAVPLGQARLFINVHPRSLTSPDAPRAIRDVVVAAGRDPRDIVLELTEHHAIVNPAAFASHLQKLREWGFQCALDDFGVGYANLRLISEIRPDYLKISGYFCLGVARDPYRQVLIRNVARMAGDLKIPVICEGIETEEEHHIVRQLGVPFGQGYLFSRPHPGTDLARRYLGAAPASPQPSVPATSLLP